MLRRVPTGTSGLRGTIAVSVRPCVTRANFTWLPYWPTSWKPADSRRRLISRRPSGLSRPNLYLNVADSGRVACNRWLEMKFESLAQIGERFFFGFALTGEIQIQARRDEPVSFTPDRCGERAPHRLILPQAAALRMGIHISQHRRHGRAVPVPRLLESFKRGLAHGTVAMPLLNRLVWSNLESLPRLQFNPRGSQETGANPRTERSAIQTGRFHGATPKGRREVGSQFIPLRGARLRQLD